MLSIEDIDEATTTDILRRVDDLVALNEPTRPDREKIRDLMDGGKHGLARLVGQDIGSFDEDQVPAVNLMLMANTRLAQKLGMRPDTKVDAPAHMDSERVHKYAQKRRRYVDTLDAECKLEVQLPQAARWLPGYGFAVWTVKQARDRNGQPYPHAELRDSFNCYPGEFGSAQQPHELAFVYESTPEALARQYPEHADALMAGHRAGSNFGSLPRDRGGVILSDEGRGSWRNQSGSGLEVVEYWNEDGTWWVVRDLELLLDFVPNPLSRPAFVFVPRYSFNQLHGQYDHIVGLMSSIARLNALSIVQAERAVFAETNIYGETMDGEYHQGRDQTNQLLQGSKVEKMNERIPFEVFQQIDRMEKQLRQGASYPVTDDAGSPISFVTGQGIAELTASMDLEVAEYQTLLRWGLELLDSLRLEWAQTVFPSREISLSGVAKDGAYAEKFKAKTHIAGQFKTRRVYGIMAGWDEPNKIAAGANLVQMEAISLQDFRENIAGLEDHTKSEERIRQEKVERTLFQGLLARAEDPNDKMTIGLLVKMLPESEMKKLFEEAYGTEEEQQPDPMAAMGDPMAALGGGGGGVPDVASVMASLRGTDPDNPEGSTRMTMSSSGQLGG